MTGFNTQLSAECISLLNLVMALSSLNNICAIKSMIVLEMKCPQLSKAEATAARNENSIGDRMEKKPWEKPGSVGGPVPLRPDESVVRSNCSKVSVSGPLVPLGWMVPFPDGCLGDEVLTGDLSLGLIYVS